MSTVLSIKNGVESFIGDLSNVLFTQTDMLRYINYGIGEIARQTRSLQATLIGTSATLSSLDQYGGILLPADFVAELDVYYGQGTASQRLVRLPMDSFSGEIMQPTAAQPSGYTITDYVVTAPGQRMMLLYPALTPGLTGQYYRINYVSMPAALVGDSDVIPTPPIFDEILVMYAVRRCKMQENDYQAADYYKREIEERLKLMASEFSDHSDLRNYQVRDEITPIYSIWES